MVRRVEDLIFLWPIADGITSLFMAAFHRSSASNRRAALNRIVVAGFQPAGWAGGSSFRCHVSGSQDIDSFIAALRSLSERRIGSRKAGRLVDPLADGTGFLSRNAAIAFTECPRSLTPRWVTTRLALASIRPFDRLSSRPVGQPNTCPQRGSRSSIDGGRPSRCGTPLLPRAREQTVRDASAGSPCMHLRASNSMIRYA